MSAPATAGERPTALVYSQALFGAGSWIRAAALAAALARQFRVALVSGGRLDAELPSPIGVTVERLPALELETWHRLVSADGAADFAELKRRRVEHLVGLLRRYQPAALITEYFPFCRHILADELTAWFAAARELTRPPLIVCSLRDIQETCRKGQAAHDARACELANRYFDAILVHSDPRWLRLEDSFAAAARLDIPIIHTGFVAPDWAPPPRRPKRKPRIVVSAGGGRGGENLLLAAVAAQSIGDLGRDFTMCVFAGVGLPESGWESLCRAAAGVPSLELSRWTPDLRSELAAAAVSVSQCGYNTALDLLRTAVPALVIPYVRDAADEQSRRAEILERLGLVRVLAPDRANPERLAVEIRRTATFTPQAVEISFDGGRCSAEWLVRRLSLPTTSVTPALRRAPPHRTLIPTRPLSLPGEFWGITTVFNPAGDSDRVVHLHRFAAGVRAQGLRLMIVELALGDAPFVVADVLADQVVRLRSDVVLWHRERLINLGLARLPEQCDKVAWLDGDILFEDSRWVDRTAERLESFNLVQPYQTACWLPRGLTWAPAEDFGVGSDPGQALAGLAYRMSVAPPDIQPPANAEPFLVGHTGLAWAGRREILERHGLYDAMILGGGDLVIGHILFGGQEYWGRKCLHRLMLSRPQFSHLADWGIPFTREVGGSVGYTPGRVLHLWHGRGANQTYLERMSILREIDFDPRADLEADPSGCWTWRRPRPDLAARIRGYFHNRQADP
jgi:predicted glycosyltransferase